VYKIPVDIAVFIVYNNMGVYYENCNFTADIMKPLPDPRVGVSGWVTGSDDASVGELDPKRLKIRIVHIK